MDVVIQINDPVIIPPEYFLVRYRLLPNGIFIDLGVQDNDEFTIPGVLPGTYELEVRFVNEEGVVCPAVLIEFTVPVDPPPDDCTCMGLTEIYVQLNCDNTATIHIDFDGTDTGACSYEITYTEFGGFNPQTVTYGQGTLPPFLDLNIPFSNSIHPPIVTIKVICCNGETLDCYNQEVTDIRDQDCDCQPPYIDAAWINVDTTTLPVTYSIGLTFSSGGITTAPYTISYEQMGTNPADTGSFVESAPGFYEFDIDPEPFTGDLVYRVIVHNPCGRDMREVRIFKCNSYVGFIPGPGYPTSFTLQVSPVAGLQIISLDTFGSPDKMIIEIAGVQVYDTGYVGNASYQSALDAALAAQGDPPESIVPVTPGPHDYYYNNATGTPYIQIKMYNPLANPNWTLFSKCN